jgi:hypothetical protein
MRFSRAFLLIVILLLNVGCDGSSAGSTTPAAGLYPDYNQNPSAPDAIGMDSTAVQLASKIRLGLNIVDTMEAIGGETCWRCVSDARTTSLAVV